MADPIGPNKRAGARTNPMPDAPSATRDATDPMLRRDLWHSIGVSALAVLLSGGLLYLVYVVRVWRVATSSAQQVADAEHVLVFGKRLQQGRPDHDYRTRLVHATCWRCSSPIAA